MCKETFSYYECCCRFVSSYLESCGNPCPGDLTPEPHLLFLSERCAECQQTPSSERPSNQSQQLIAKRKSRALQHIAARWNERELALKRLNQHPHKKQKKDAQQDATQAQHIQQLPHEIYHTSADDNDESGSLKCAVLRVNESKLDGIEPSGFEKTSDVFNGSQVSMPIPLSELLLDVPLVETEAYIRRPKELREKEWTKRHNFPRIPRPMNVFLLYRRAVSERAKEYAGVTNHQTVSRIAAASWKNESDGVKDTFRYYANLEKKYHDKAFPDYKFSPQRTQSTKASKRKRKGEDSEDPNGSNDDPEYRDRKSIRKKRVNIGAKQSTSIEQISLHLWQYSVEDSFDVSDSGHDQLPYPTDPRLDLKELQRNSQLGAITSSAVTHVELPEGNQDLHLESTGVMEQSGFFNTDTIDPNLSRFNSHGNGSGDLTLSDLEYIQAGDFLSSLGQNQDWELNNYNAPINDSEFEELFDQIKS